jgi:hypothetical protein
MRILAPLILLLSSGMFVSTTLAADAPDRPPGIDADHWVVLGDSIGVVLTTGEATRTGSDWARAIPPRDALIAPTRPFVREAVERAEAREPIHGYLMVKQGGMWRRLIVTSP